MHKLELSQYITM